MPKHLATITLTLHCIAYGSVNLFGKELIACSISALTGLAFFTGPYIISGIIN